MLLSATKIIKILSKFTKEEVSSFEKWLASPWCNPTKCLVDILVALKKYHPEFDNRRLTKRLIFEKALGRVPSDRRMNNLLSEMYLQAEQFLVHERVKKDHYVKTDLLTSEFSERKLREWFMKKMEKELATFKLKEVKETEDYFFAYQLYRKLHNQPYLTLKERKNNPVLESMMEQLKVFILLENAAIINGAFSLNKALNKTDEQLPIEIQNWLTMSKGIDHPSINLFRKRFEFSADDDENRFKTLEPIFLKSYKSIHPKEQKIHFALLLNDFLRLRRKGKFETEDALPLFKLGAKELWILQEGAISTIQFTNILSTSNAAKDFSFSYWFIEKFAPLLPEELREEGKTYGLAHTSNKEEKYEKAIEILNKTEFKSNYFRRVSRLTTTQAYFNLHLHNQSYQSFLLDYCDAFEKQLRREKVQGTIRSWIRFVQFTRTLSKLYYAIPFELTKIETLFKDTSDLQGATWLKTQKEKILILKK